MYALMLEEMLTNALDSVYLVTLQLGCGELCSSEMIADSEMLNVVKQCSGSLSPTSRQLIDDI